MATLPLLPVSSPKLIGIARLAADGESLRQGHDVEYFTLPVKSLLNRCTVARMPFTWTINPYRGCEFACKYCYARYTHEFMEMRDGVDFEQKIYVKQHAANLLRQELRRVKPGEEIAIGTATDPYQPAERRFEVTRAILEELVRHEGLELGIITKGNLILRDLDLAQGTRTKKPAVCKPHRHYLERGTGAHPRAEGAAPRPADGSRSQIEPGGSRRRNKLLARDSRHHGFAARSGGAGSRHFRSRRETHIRQPVIPKTVFRRRLHAFSGKGISAAGSGLSRTLQGSRIFAQELRQADLAADGTITAEVWNPTSRP